MPAAQVERLYALREAEVQRLAVVAVIHAADLRDLDRGARFKVACELFDRCDKEAKDSLRNDSHHSVRSAALLANNAGRTV